MLLFGAFRLTVTEVIEQGHKCCTSADRDRTCLEERAGEEGLLKLTVLHSDCHGFRNPCRLWVGYTSATPGPGRPLGDHKHGLHC
jgi:hypothetical protein